MRWLLPLLLLATTGCSLDCPRGGSYCEGELLAHCQTNCTGDTKTNRSCTPSVSTFDCNTLVPGVKKACRELTYNGGRDAVCLDVALTPCTVAPGEGRVARPTSCLPDGHILYCYTSGSEAFEDTRECERAGLVCTPSGGITCVDAAKTPCDPAQFPRCKDGRFELNCYGNEDAGHFLRTDDCGATRLCRESDAGQTYCADP